MKKPAPFQAAPPKGCPAWMMTFGDIMSLLVCFFVILIAFSNMEEEKLSGMLGAMRGALGGVEFVGMIETPVDSRETDGLTKSEGESKSVRYLTVEEMSEMVPTMIEEIRASGRQGGGSWPDRVLISMLDEGLSIVVHTSTLFKPGTIEWLTEDCDLWTGIAALLKGRNNAIHVTAVLSPDDPANPNPANALWRLGIMRADAVAKALETAMQVSPQQIGIGVQLSLGFDTKSVRSEAVEITILGQNDAVDLDAEAYFARGMMR